MQVGAVDGLDIIVLHLLESMFVCQEPLPSDVPTRVDLETDEVRPVLEEQLLEVICPDVLLGFVLVEGDAYEGHSVGGALRVVAVRKRLQLRLLSLAQHHAVSLVEQVVFRRQRVVVHPGQPQQRGPMATGTRKHFILMIAIIIWEGIPRRRRTHHQ